MFLFYFLHKEIGTMNSEKAKFYSVQIKTDFHSLSQSTNIC